MIQKLFSRKSLLTILTICMVLMYSSVYAKDYIIYAISHQLPMVNKQESRTKDMYVNLGKSQGVQEGTILDVFRVQTEQNPFESNKRYTYKIKIGELKVIHSDGEAAIGRVSKMEAGEDAPIFEFEKFMIGDQVTVHVK